MKYIEKIEVKDFFNTGNLVWHLNQHVNILGGKNGSGKSTLFKACFCALSDPQGMNKLNALMSPIAKSMTITMSDGSKILWQRNENGETVFPLTFPVRFQEPLVKIIEVDGTEIALSELQKQVDVHLIDSFEQHLSKAIKYNQQPQSAPLNGPSMLDLLIKDQIELRNADFSLVMEKYADEPSENAQDHSQYLQQYKQLYDVLMSFLTDYDDKPKSNFEFRKGGISFGYEHLSMGEKQILLLLLMVSNTRGNDCIFFMDEPDLSMHIDWKEKLVTALHKMNPKMQIILSTHAPSVITG